MSINLTVVETESLLDLRESYRREADTQIVHDQISSRAGWTRNVLFEINDERAGFATIAVAGPWRDHHTLLEFYFKAEFIPFGPHVFRQLRRFDPFPRFELQTIQHLAISLVWQHAATVECEKIVFRDGRTTTHQQPDLILVPRSEPDEIREAIHVRSGGGTWALMRGDAEVGSGGFLCHYNVPYADIHMEIVEAERGNGFGRFLIQELKRICQDWGQIPAARCNATNLASYATLLHAGFVPSSQILVGAWKPLG